jgi:hypothetical protein
LIYFESSTILKSITGILSKSSFLRRHITPFLNNWPFHLFGLVDLVQTSLEKSTHSFFGSILGTSLAQENTVPWGILHNILGFVFQQEHISPLAP